MVQLKGIFFLSNIFLAFNFTHFFCSSSDNKIISNEDLQGWKAKLKVPPKDNRIKTSVS